LAVDTPGCDLASNPGLLSFKILTDAWYFALRQFVHDKKWTKEEVKAYLSLVCINKSTIEYFTRCCSNYLLLQDLNDMPENYDDDVVPYVKKDYFGHPQLYQLPPPTLAWSIGTMDQRVGTIMHLAMNTQKAVFSGYFFSGHLQWKKERNWKNVSNLGLSQFKDCVSPIYLAACSGMQIWGVCCRELPCFDDAVSLDFLMSFGSGVFSPRFCATTT
jgi:hypothetical protein